MSLPFVKGTKAVITAGGIGTRLLPFSKEIPKEMVPILTRNSSKTMLVKPIIQAIYEQLYGFGFRDFFVVVGRGKRAIEDHFTPDSAFLESLRARGKSIADLERFYEMLKNTNMVFVMQPTPSGFGDAVLRTRPYVGDRFLVHAGDTYIISHDDDYLRRLEDIHASNSADATILLQDVEDPRQFGVVLGEETSKGVVRIRRAVEKPSQPTSKVAIMPVYLFNDKIFPLLAQGRPGVGGELQLTDAIQSLIAQGSKVMGVKLKKEEIRLDIGSAQTLIDALRLTSEYFDDSEKPKSG